MPLDNAAFPLRLVLIGFGAVAVPYCLELPGRHGIARGYGVAQLFHELRKFADVIQTAPNLYMCAVDVAALPVGM